MNNTFKINNLTVDAEFRDFLLFSNCRVSVVFKSFESTLDIDYIGVSDKVDSISYLPKSKVKSVLLSGVDPYSDGIGRAECKVGKIIFKTFDKSIITQYIQPFFVEEFVNEYKSFFDQSNRILKVISGEEIRYAYLDENYSYPTHGTLWKSCMRYPDKQRYLDIYIKNPDKVKMLAMYSTIDGDQKVRARALLWEAEDLNGNSVRIMDRIYSIYDCDIVAFKKWARDNGYITKYYQNAKSQNLFDIDNSPITMNLKVKLDKHDLGHYPYLDSFQFYKMSDGLFYNCENMYYDYTLIQSNGGLYPPPEDDDEMDYDDFSDYVDDQQEW